MGIVIIFTVKAKKDFQVGDLIFLMDNKINN